MAFYSPAGDGRLYYEVYGEDSGGPSLVFLNGTAQTTANWRPLALGLKDRHRVVLYDARCQGRSDCGAEALSLERHGEDLAGLMDHLSVERAVLVGLSHGARVALAAAGRRESRVAGLILLSLGLAASTRMACALMAWRAALHSGGCEGLMQAMMPLVFGERFLREHRLVRSKIIAALVQRNDERKMAQLLAAIDGYPPVEAILPTKQVPSMVLSGKDDPLVSDTQARALAIRLGADYRRLPDTGHSIPAEAPEALMEAIAIFFTQFPNDAMP